MDHVDFGRYLTQQRELRGMSREDVSRATKISAALLAALEGGQVDRLPARVFILNYVKAYARAIGLSPEEALLRFEEIDRTLETQPPPAALERVRRKRAWLTLVGVLLVLAAAGYAMMVFLGRLPPPQVR